MTGKLFRQLCQAQEWPEVCGGVWNALAIRAWEHDSWFFLSHSEGSLRGRKGEHSKILGIVVGAWGASG